MTDPNISKLEIIEFPNSIMANLIDDAEEILKDIDEYSDIMPEYKFKNIKIYGNNKNPCFQANCIFDYLFPKYRKDFDSLNENEKKKRNKARENKFTRWISENFDFNLNNTIDDDIFKSNIKNNSDDNRYYECYILTETGMLTAMCSNKTVLSKTFKKHIIQFIKNIRNHHEKIYNDERNKSVNKLKKELEKEREHRQELQCINNKNIQLQEAFHNPADFGNQDKTELTILQRITQKQYYLYVVDWDYINTKFWKKYPPTTAVKQHASSKKSDHLIDDLEGINFSSDDEDSPYKKPTNIKITYDKSEPHLKGIQESYELFCIDLDELKSNENQSYYFCIRPKEIVESKKPFYKFIKFINIKDITHYKAMIEIVNKGNIYNHTTSYPVNADKVVENIKDTERESILFSKEVATPDSDVFITNYSALIDARKCSFINLHKQYIIDINSRKRTYKNK